MPIVKRASPTDLIWAGSVQWESGNGSPTYAYVFGLDEHVVEIALQQLQNAVVRKEFHQNYEAWVPWLGQSKETAPEEIFRGIEESIRIRGPSRHQLDEMWFEGAHMPEVLKRIETEPLVVDLPILSFDDLHSYCENPEALKPFIIGGDYVSSQQAQPAFAPAEEEAPSATQPEPTLAQGKEEKMPQRRRMKRSAALNDYDAARALAGPGLKMRAEQTAQEFNEEIAQTGDNTYSESEVIKNEFGVEPTMMSEPDEASSTGQDLEYRMNIGFIGADGQQYEEFGIDVRFQLHDAQDYDGMEPGEEGWGVNVGVDLVGYEGEMLGGLTPYNYTGNVWTTDEGELEERLNFLDPSKLVAFLFSQAIPDYLKGSLDDVREASSTTSRTTAATYKESVMTQRRAPTPRRRTMRRRATAKQIRQEVRERLERRAEARTPARRRPEAPALAPRRRRISAKRMEELQREKRRNERLAALEDRKAERERKERLAELHGRRKERREAEARATRLEELRTARPEPTRRPPPRPRRRPVVEAAPVEQKKAIYVKADNSAGMPEGYYELDSVATQKYQAYLQRKEAAPVKKTKKRKKAAAAPIKQRKTRK